MNKRVLNKRILAFLMAFIMCLASACTLVGTPDEYNVGGNNGELTLDGDYLVGLFVYVSSFDGGDINYYPTNNFDDENSWYLYNKIDYEEYPHGLVPCVSTLSQGNILASNPGVTGIGGAPNGKIVLSKIELSAVFYFTYELIGSVLYMEGVYRTEDGGYYAGGGNGHHLNSIGKAGTSLSQNMSASRTNIDGTKEEIKFEGKVSLDIEMLDYLTGARIVEFDSEHNVIKNTEIDLLDDYEYNSLSHNPLENCEYAIIEKDFEVMHQAEHSSVQKGTRYTERVLIDKAAQNFSDTLYIPQGNGLVRPLWVSLAKKTDEENIIS